MQNKEKRCRTLTKEMKAIKLPPLSEGYKNKICNFEQYM